MDQPVLSSHDLAHFAEQGFVRVTAALPPPYVAQTQKEIWDQLHAHYGIAQQEPATWRPGWCGINKKFIDSVVGVEITPRLATAIDQLLGVAQWRSLKTLGGLLMTMPEPEGSPWNPTLDWHFDNDPHAYLGRVDELMLFSFFSPVQPRGGGTLVLAGSPRLLEHYHQTIAEGSVAETHPQTSGLAAWYPWLAQLLNSRLHDADSLVKWMAEPVEVYGVPLQIFELTGEPGDAFLCHPSLLHTVSMNCATIPRIMRRTNVRRKR